MEEKIEESLENTKKVLEAHEKELDVREENGSFEELLSTDNIGTRRSLDPNRKYERQFQNQITNLRRKDILVSLSIQISITGGCHCKWMEHQGQSYVIDNFTTRRCS